VSGLTGKTAIVTGSARGIGKAVALRYASLRANVVVNYLSDPAAAEAIVADVKKFGIEVRADVSALADIERIFAEALARFPLIDIVVASAVVEKVGIPLVDVTEAQFDQLYAINTKGALFTLQATTHHVVDGGRIIYLGSITSELPMMGLALYGSSKIGPRYVAQVLAQELGHRSVAVNAILLTAIEGAGMFTGANPDDPVRKMVARGNRMVSWMGAVDDVADAAEYFASDLAAWAADRP
jgi:3-oxoacyl-[acyl-carrier protein] reductase